MIDDSIGHTLLTDPEDFKNDRNGKAQRLTAEDLNAIATEKVAGVPDTKGF